MADIKNKISHPKVKKVNNKKVDTEIQALVKEETRKALASVPINLNYDPNDEGYRRLTSRSTRDLSPMGQDTMFEYAYYMWDFSGTFRRLALLDNTFMFGEPISIVANDQTVQQWINYLWEENSLDVGFPDFCLWESILGEQCWPVDIRETDGFVTIGYEDPYDILDVLVASTNKRMLGKVILKDGTTGKERNIVDVIRMNNDPSDKKGYGRLKGNCFFFSINHPPNSPRGRSDFRTLLDYIDAWERYSYNFLERAELMLNYIWDVKITGGPAEVEKFKEENKIAPLPGAVRAHNQNVEWKAEAPNMNSFDVKTGSEMGKNVILGMAGRPDSWFGSGGKSYQNEAELQAMVPIKDLDKRQYYHKKQLIYMIKFFIDQGIVYGSINPKADLSFTVNMPEISKKDLAKIAGVLPAITNSVIFGISEGLITRRTASRTLISAINQMGDEINPEEEFKAAQEEIKLAKVEDISQYEDYMKVAKMKKGMK